jgi:transposase
MDALRAFLHSSAALAFSRQDRAHTYAWIERTLRRYDYLARPRAGKGLLRRYLQKLTGLSRAQIARLIAQFRRIGQVRLRPYRRHRFPSKFTREDTLLLAEVDEAHDCLSAPATVAILKREYALFGHQEFARLSTISVAHLYRLRQSTRYRAHTTSVAKTKPSTAAYGERRRPDPQGQPGYLRVDTVHQGGREGQKSLYHLNTVDAVTQWEILGCVPQISERFLVPVLEALLAQYPFAIRGFHSDNGSEFINHVVAELLNKLLIEFTKSRPRRTND